MSWTTGISTLAVYGYFLVSMGGWRAFTPKRVWVPLLAGVLIFGITGLYIETVSSTKLGVEFLIAAAALATGLVAYASRLAVKRKKAIDLILERVRYQQMYLRNNEPLPPGKTPTLAEDLNALLLLIDGTPGAPGHKQVTPAWVRAELGAEQLRLTK